MKLYHFTSKYHLPGCLQYGLIKGCVLASTEPIKLLFNYQWLTKNKSFNQEWCEYTSLPYNRNDYRITIKIPRREMSNLIKWLTFCKTEKLETAEVANSFGDPENWYLYHGNIDRQWIKIANRNPNLR